MKTATIRWEDSYMFSNEHDGKVNNVTMFFIRRKGVKKITYELFSYPFRNNVFTKANNTKKIFTDTDLSKVKEFAEIAFEQYVNMFLEIGMDKKTETYLTQRIKNATTYESSIALNVVRIFLNKH